MPSKFDRLRSGEVVEIEPGRKGRLNLQEKTFETSDGRTMYVGDDPDFFPSNEEALAHSRQKEGLQREIKKAPAGEFLYQFGNQGIAGAVKNSYNKLTQKGDEYLRSQRVNQEVSQEISKGSPFTSAAATAASFIPDIAATRGMSALKAAPALTAMHAGPRLIEEPGQVAGEAALSAAGGFLIDKGAKALSNIAKRRGEVRALPRQIQNVRNANIAGEQAVAESNMLQKQQFEALKQAEKNVHAKNLQQYEADLNARQNTILQEQKAFDQRKFQRDAEIVRLKNKASMEQAQNAATAAQSDSEYRAAKEAADLENKRMADKFKQAQTQYETELKQLPELQKKAQAEKGNEIFKTATEIEKMFPPNSRIPTDNLDINNFIQENVTVTGLAGSREASQANRVIKALFPEGELIGGRELSKRYKALEDAIQRATPEVQKVLNEFKQHLGEKLPGILEDFTFLSKISPLIHKSIDKDIKTAIDSLGISGKNIDANIKKLINTANRNVRGALREELNANNFIERVQSGEFSRSVANKLLSSEDFLFDINPLDRIDLKKSGLINTLMDDANTKHSYFVDKLSKEIQNKLERYEIKALEAARIKSRKFKTDIQKTYGMAETVAPPVPPTPFEPVAEPSRPELNLPQTSFELPPPIAPMAQAPPMPVKPSLGPGPTPPIPQTYNAIPEPVLAPPGGIAERAGDLLEKNILGGNTLANNPFTKLAGLKYVLGKGALPLEAGYAAMKGLTSPTAAGEMARMTFKQGGIEAIERWASQYPSYHNGILEDPMDRRSLTKEVENDFDIPIEQKAVIQSKINRGKPLQERL